MKTAKQLRRELQDARWHLAALRRIVRRTLACGQLEKLDDARPYLVDGWSADQPAATETGPLPRTHRAGQCAHRLVGHRTGTCLDCGATVAEQAPQGAPPEPLDENWLSTRRPARGS